MTTNVQCSDKLVASWIQSEGYNYSMDIIPGTVYQLNQNSTMLSRPTSSSTYGQTPTTMNLYWYSDPNGNQLVLKETYEQREQIQRNNMTYLPSPFLRTECLRSGFGDISTGSDTSNYMTIFTKPSYGGSSFIFRPGAYRAVDFANQQQTTQQQVKGSSSTPSDPLTIRSSMVIAGSPIAPPTFFNIGSTIVAGNIKVTLFGDADFASPVVTMITGDRNPDFSKVYFQDFSSRGIGSIVVERMSSNNPIPVDQSTALVVQKNIYSNWSNWSACDKPCGSGSQKRIRSCLATVCDDPLEETQVCNTQSCPINGSWSQWTDWGVCDKPCGGVKKRTRICNNPPPQYGGLPCDGSDTETQQCDPCPSPTPSATPSPTPSATPSATISSISASLKSLKYWWIIPLSLVILLILLMFFLL